MSVKTSLMYFVAWNVAYISTVAITNFSWAIVFGVIVVVANVGFIIDM